MTRASYRFFIKDWRELKDIKQLSAALSTNRFSVNMEPVLMSCPEGKRIFVIAPHPDDEMLGPGGTLIHALADEKAKIRVLHLTRGRQAIATQTVSEAKEVASRLGYDTVQLEYFSKEIPLDDVCLSALIREISSFKPDTIMLPFFGDDHDDHRRASHLLLLAIDKAPWLGRLELWAYQVYSSLIPNVIVNITDVANSKRDAIKIWKSQSSSRDWSHYALGLNAYNSRFLSGVSGEAYAEMFFVLPAYDYCEFCRTYFDKTLTPYYSKNYV